MFETLPVSLESALGLLVPSDTSQQEVGSFREGGHGVAVYVIQSWVNPDVISNSPSSLEQR